ARPGAGDRLRRRADRVGRPGQGAPYGGRSRWPRGGGRRRREPRRSAEVTRRGRAAQEALEPGSLAQSRRPSRMDERSARAAALEDSALPHELSITIQPQRSRAVRATIVQDTVTSMQIDVRHLVVYFPDDRQHSEAANFLVPPGVHPGLTWRWSLNAYDGGHYRQRRANLLSSSSPGHPRIATGVDDDESRPDRRDFEGLEPDQERDGNDRQHDLRQHHRRTVEGRQGRASGLRKLPDPPPQLAKGAQSQDWIERRRAPEAGPLLQGRKAAARARQRLKAPRAV